MADVWVKPLTDGSSLRQLTFGGLDHFPVVSPDGERVAFQSESGGSVGIHWRRFDGTGSAEALTKPEVGISHMPESWSPDGKTLLFAELKNSQYTLWALSVEDKHASAIGNIHSAAQPQAVFSPDGRWIAYHLAASIDRRSVSNVSATERGVWLRRFPVTNDRFKLPQVANDFHPLWKPDASALFYVPFVGSLISVGVTMTPTAVTFSDPIRLTPSLRSGTFQGRGDFGILPVDGF